MTDDQKIVAIYRATLFKASETFVTAQAKLLHRYDPHLVGCQLDKQHTGKQQDGFSLAWPSKTELMKTAFGKESTALSEVLATTKATVTHAHFGPDATQIMPSCKALAIPLVVTLHGFDVLSKRHSHRSPQWLAYLMQQKKTADYASTVICVSDFLYKNARKHGAYKKANLIRHYIGIDYDHIVSQAEPYQAQKADNQIAFVGRLAPKKGIPDFVKIIRHLRGLGYKNPVTIVGDGIEAPLVKRLCSEYEDITWLGAQPHDVLLQVLSQSAVAILPSQTASSGDAESLGLVFAEALAAGCAPVGYRHGGIAEVTPEDLLVEEKDLQALFTKTQKILDNKIMRDELVTLGKKHIQDNFDIRRQTPELEDIYDSTSS